MRRGTVGRRDLGVVGKQGEILSVSIRIITLREEHQHKGDSELERKASGALGVSERDEVRVDRSSELRNSLRCTTSS
jgi:hypothetical protein